MKITIIQPPIEDFYSTPLRRQPLGLLYLAGALAKNGYQPRLINGHSPKKKRIALPKEFSYLNPWMENQDPKNKFPFLAYYHFGLSYEEIRRQIKQSPSGLFAVSAHFTPYYQETEAVLKIIREEHPGSLIAVGGPHASLYPEYFITQGLCDYVVLGEGEEAIVLLADAIKTQAWEKIALIPNVVQKNNLERKKICPIESLDALANPLRELLKPRDFKMYGKNGVALVFSRGCPNHCTFCTSKNIFGAGYRFRSAESLLNEMEECWKNFGVTFFNFEDDNLFKDQQQAHFLLEKLVVFQEERKIQLDLAAMNGISIEALMPETLLLMKKAGFREINLSLVTSSESLQQRLNRPFNSTHFARIAQTAKKLALNSRAYFILGLPGQSQKEVTLTMEFLNSLKVKAIPSVYYNVTALQKDWKIQRSSAFANETEYFSRGELIRFFNQIVFGYI